MKRLIAILFLLIYTGTALGITIDLHYCQGKMVKFSILNISKPPKCCCQDFTEPMAKGCCKDEVKICKTDNYKTARHFVAINPVHQDLAPLVLPLLITYTDLQTQTSVITYNRFKRSPEPIYLLFQVFRI